jgi:hypothetical protein
MNPIMLDLLSDEPGVDRQGEASDSREGERGLLRSLRRPREEV